MSQCAYSHSTIQILNGKVYGGSCIHPLIEECDVYIGLDEMMRHHKRMHPWEGKYAILHPVKNMGVPRDVDAFANLANWTLEQLEQGAKVHIGCIGGHGRTGMLLSLLVHEAMEKPRAIQWVRANYCKKAVETKDQVDWLVKHFGMVTAPVPKKYVGAKMSNQNVMAYAAENDNVWRLKRK